MPGAWFGIMDRHQRREATAPDQRHADGRRYPDIEERLRLGWRQLAMVIADDQRLSTAKVVDGKAAEAREAVMAQDAGCARSGPFAADGKAVLVIVHVRIGAHGDTEVVTEQL